MTYKTTKIKEDQYLIHDLHVYFDQKSVDYDNIRAKDAVFNFEEPNLGGGLEDHILVEVDGEEAILSSAITYEYIENTQEANDDQANK